MKCWVVIHIEKGDTMSEQKNEIVVSGGQKLQKQLLQELEVNAQQMGQDFTDYGKKCVINAIGGLLQYCKSQGIELKQLDPTLLRLALQNIGYTELNYSANPSEVYFDIRKNGDYYIATIKPQGAGNEKLTRKYGVGLVKDTGLKSPWLVREGDEFVLPTFDGLEMNPPKWTPKSLDGKVVAIVYPAQKIDGSVEYLMASRESVKANIIAQIRQNALYKFKKKVKGQNGKEYEVPDKEKRDEFYKRVDAELENMKVDEILANPEWLEWVNPTYSSGGSKEQMIIRKMKNNALKNYPKEYDNAYIKDSVENMYEDRDDSLDEKPKKIQGGDVDVVEKVEKEINAPVNETAPKDFKVSEDGEVVKEEKKVVDAVVEKKQEEIPQSPSKPEEENKAEPENNNSVDYEKLF